MLTFTISFFRNYKMDNVLVSKRKTRAGIGSGPSRFPQRGEARHAWLPAGGWCRRGTVEGGVGGWPPTRPQRSNVGRGCPHHPSDFDGIKE